MDSIILSLIYYKYKIRFKNKKIYKINIIFINDN